MTEERGPDRTATGDVRLPEQIENDVIEALKACYDPEIPVNIYEIGLIYEINLTDDGKVHILMTLTSPNCPVAESLPLEAKQSVELVEGVKEVDIELTFVPPWTMDLLSDEARLELGMF